MRLPSIRQKLTLWYVGVLGVVLVLFGSLLYVSVAASIIRDADRALSLQADSVAEQISSFQEAERAAGTYSPGNWQASSIPAGPTPLDREMVSPLVKRWAGRTDTLKTDQIIALIDRYGQTLAVSGGFQKLEGAFSETRIREALEGATLYQTLRLPGRRRFRLVTRPINQYGRVRYLVQVASSLEEVDHSLTALRLWLLGLIPLTLLVAVAGGFSVTTRALKPLDRMMKQTQEIRAEAVDTRIDVPETGDELEHLAVAFNDLLDRVERTFRRQRQFSAAASHELRTPLTVMKGELEVALRRSRAPEEYQRVLQAHLEAINEMTGTVEAMLLLARSEATEATLEWKPIDLTVLVRKMAPIWQKTAGAKKIQLEILAAGPVGVRGEERLIERLVANLLDNAVRHTPAEGKIAVRVDHWKGRACLVVQDTGTGIRPDDLPRIFDRFFLPSAGNSNSSSTGLGLGLCRWIAEIHHGRIEVASPTGQGTTFTVWLPLVGAPSSPVRSTAPALRPR